MKRTLAFLLALCLIFGQVPATVFAAEPGTAPEETAEHHEEPEVTAPPAEEEPTTLSDTSGYCGRNLKWDLSAEGVLTISGEGTMYDFVGSARPWQSSCANITSLVIEDGVMSIGENAFLNCYNMSSVSLPESLFTIGAYAFWGCTSLSNVTIPDSGNTINQRAFGACMSLSSITIGEGVRYIGDEAFVQCESLSSVFFRGDVPTFDMAPFWGLKNITVYYPVGNETWTEEVINNLLKNENWTAMPYNPDSKAEIVTSVVTREQLLQLAIKPIYINDPMQLLKWKNVTLDDVTFDYFEGSVNSSSGLMISHEKAMKQDIVLSKEEYWDYVLPTAVAATLMNSESDKNLCYSLTAYMLKDRKDGKPYISTIFGRETGSDNPYQDLRVTALTASKGKTQDIIVTAVGLEGKNATYYLAQDEARRVESKNGVFSAQDLFSVFEDGSTVYAYAKTADGTITEPQAIKISRNDPEAELLNFFEQSEFSLFGSDFLKFTAPDSIPLLGGMEFSLSAIEIPLGFDIQNDVVKISIGMDVFKRKSDGDGVKTEDIFHDFKDMVYSASNGIQSGKNAIDAHKLAEKAMQQFAIRNGVGMPNWWALGKKSNSFNINVLGYVEGKIVDNKIVVKECALSIGGTLTFKYTAQGAVWIVPVYGSVEAGGSITATSKDFKIIPASDIPFEHDIILDINPKVTGRAGVGVKGAASAGLYATGSLPIKVEFKRNHFTMSLKGEIGAEAEVFILKGDKVILEGDTMLVEKYWDSKSMSVDAVTVMDDGAPDLSSTVTTVVSRDYADSTSDWLGNWYFAPTVDSDGSSVAAKGVSFRDLQTSIFANSQPQLVTVGDQMLLVWVEDDLNRDAYNRMRLVYSVYDPMTETWSEPQPVWDDGHNDGYPILTSDGETAYVLWQKVNTTLTEENTTDIDAALENSELCLAKFENGAFVDAQMITSDSLYEYAHNVVILDGEPVVFWATAKENAMNVSGNNALYRWENGAAEELARNLNYILSIDAIDGEVTYVMDADGDLATTADVTAFAISDAGTTSFDNSEMEAAITWAGYVPLDGEQVLFFCDMGNIYYEQDGELKSVLSEVRTMGGNLNIVETDLGTAILWTEQVEGWNELFVATYADGIWSEPVQISENNELLTKVVATCYDGKLTGICNANAVTYDEETDTYTKGETDLALFTVNDFSDIELGSYLTINEAELEIGEETELYVTVYNNGTLPVDEVTFTVSDTLGTESVQTVAVEIPSGGSELVTLTYPVPEGYGSTTLTITASTAEADANEEDNSVSLEIGNHDLSVTETAVEMLEGGYLLKATVENGSLVDAENVTLSVSMEEEGEALQTVGVGNIERENYALAEILLVENALSFDENGVAKVYLKLNANGTESSTVDNRLCIVIRQADETVCMHPETETVEKLDATCTETGHEAYDICIACGEVVGGIVEIPAGHSYENGFCTGCGEADPEYMPENPSGTCGDNLSWSITDGVLTISGEGDMWNFGDANEIPWMDYYDRINSVVIGEGVTSIGDCAFAFLPITSVTIPETVTHIGIASFGYTMNLTSVELPDSLISIGEEAFGISGLTEVTIPANLSSLGAKAFVCPNMTAIYVDEANTNCYSWKGLLYSGANLIQVPGGYTGELELNSLTMAIADYALLYCGKVTKLIVPANINQIGQNAFQGCNALTEIQFLGDTPDTIAEGVFAGMALTISHPDANTTWTDEAKQAFGEGITWTTHGVNLVATGFCGENNLYNEDYTQYSTCDKDLVAGENAVWTLTADGTMTISGQGKMVDNFIVGGHPWFVITMRDSTRVTRFVLEEGITHVGAMSFMCFGHLGQYITEVSLPSTVKSLGYGALAGLTALEELDIPEGITRITQFAFMSCEALTSLEIPASVTVIEAQAFSGCTALTEIKFLDDAPTIAEDALTDVVATAYYPANNATWTEEVMQSYGGTITWEPYSTVTEVATGWSGATQWTLTDDGVLNVYGKGNMKNYGYNGGQPWLGKGVEITSVVIEEGVTAVGTGAFRNLTTLESVTLPESGLTKIGEAAFYGCESLKEITIPEGIYTVWAYTFKGCTALEKVKLPKTLIKIDQGAFENCTSLPYMFYPTNLEIIGSWSFKGCTALVEADMQWADATEIREGAFKNCSALTRIILPSNIQVLGDSCFYGIGAKRFTVPETVTSIEPWCFARASIEEIIFVGDAPTIGEGAFNKITLTAYYPGGNATWTSATMQNYGGTVTWKAN